MTERKPEHKNTPLLSKCSVYGSFTPVCFLRDEIFTRYAVRVADDAAGSEAPDGAAAVRGFCHPA
jgi:hypothetical protein